jgi:hypothetical protein
VSLLGIVADRLADPDQAVALRDVLAPFRGRLTWVTSTSCGPTDLALGILTRAAGGDPMPYLEEAAALCARAGARRWAQLVREALEAEPRHAAQRAGSRVDERSALAAAEERVVGDRGQHLERAGARDVDLP